MARPCDDNYDWFSYFRIGLYYITRRGERKNFCDIHFGGIPNEIMEKGHYSGPKAAAYDNTTRKERSKEAKDRYFREGWVHSSLDLSAGGLAKPLFNRDLNVMDLWLLGPLLYEGNAYGSVVARLKGFVYPKSDYKDLRNDKLPEKEYDATQRFDPKLQRFKLKVPQGWGSKFMPCTMWGGDYSEGTRPLKLDGADQYPPTMNKALDAARHRLKPAILPKDVMKVVWKIEESKNELTACSVYDGKG